ncbi:hypothetical protein J2I47_04310 [Fibrella sp. HMF5335]|uniref:Circularly permuted type 2 ATP-grasp protein n=1 Tax=Fibrella rubiginis TaxID=2817060 RepID=A0A939GBE3_9BACT|nr:hypothetical protein [Fibrella rubiginis]MBO0935764.1 hypothetical protein [Fibrella rubiginis]
MIQSIRAAYNAAFTPERYAAFLNKIEADYPGQLDFRVAETPVFVPKAFTNKLLSACDAIVDTITAPDYRALTGAAIPPHQRVPNETPHTTFLAVDFAVCRNEQSGELEPQLIELQGFPSLYGFQAYLSETFRSIFSVPETVSHLFGVETNADYVAELRDLILGDCQPEEVILLEIFPEKQKTRVDFALTKHYVGIDAVCLTKIRKEGRALFYEKDGRQIRIKRIYNRLIFDELEAMENLQAERGPTGFHLTDDVDVVWVGHPNWFFRISKYTLPLLNSPYVPKSYFLSELTTPPADLENYVLKPLFSFAGSGVTINVTPADIEAIPVAQRGNYLLQRKVRYEPVITTPDGSGVKCEIRLLFIWPDGDAKPKLITNLARLSRGEMIGVRFNKDFDWVGGTIAFFEQ